jgi:hypothetical protein
MPARKRQTTQEVPEEVQEASKTMTLNLSAGNEEDLRSEKRSSETARMYQAALAEHIESGREVSRFTVDAGQGKLAANRLRGAQNALNAQDPDLGLGLSIRVHESDSGDTVAFGVTAKRAYAKS